MKEAIVQCLKNNGGDATFGTLDNEVSGFSGGGAMSVTFNGAERLLWHKMSPEAIDSITALVRDGAIHIVPEPGAIGLGLEFIPLDLVGDGGPGTLLPALIYYSRKKPIT